MDGGNDGCHTEPEGVTDLAEGVPDVDQDRERGHDNRKGGGARHFRDPRFQRARQRLGLVACADQRADRADHGKDAGKFALVEQMHGDASFGEVAHDVGLQVGESQHEIGLEGQDLVEACRGEGAHPRLGAHLGRSHGVARDADDAILLAQQVESLDRLLGQADQALRREMAHGRHSTRRGQA